MAGLDAGTHAYEAAEGSSMEGPTFDVPRSYTFKPGMSLLLSTMGSDRPNGLYCEVLFVEQGAYVVVTHEGQNFVVPQGNKPVEVGPNLLVKYDHPRVKLIPNLSTGVFRTGMFLSISSAQNAAAKQAIKDSQGPAYSMEVEDPEEEEAPAAKVLPRNPTLVADAPEVLSTYHDRGDKWIAPKDFEDEFLILEGDRVIFSAKVQRNSTGGRDLVRPGKGVIPIGSNHEFIRVRDMGVEGGPVKAMIFVENGVLTVEPQTETTLQVGSRDAIYRERLAALGSAKESVNVSSTSTIYPAESGFSTSVGPTDPERIIRMVPLGNWEAGASVMILVRDGFVVVQNLSISSPEIKTVRAMPNGPAIVIQDQAYVRLSDNRGGLDLAVIAMSSDAPMRISDSLGKPGELRRTTLSDINERVHAPDAPPSPAALKGVTTIRPSMPAEAELAQRPGCLPAPIGEVLSRIKEGLRSVQAWINDGKVDDED